MIEVQGNMVQARVRKSLKAHETNTRQNYYKTVIYVLCIKVVFTQSQYTIIFTKVYIYMQFSNDIDMEKFPSNFKVNERDTVKPIFKIYHLVLNRIVLFHNNKQKFPNPWFVCILKHTRADETGFYVGVTTINLTAENIFGQQDISRFVSGLFKDYTYIKPPKSPKGTLNIVVFYTYFTYRILVEM